MKQKIKENQVWICKRDGSLLFIGKRHDGMSWNTTNSRSKRVIHKVTEMMIRQHYELYTEDTPVVEEPDENYVVCKAITTTFKTPPPWLPKPIHKWLLHGLVEIHEIKVRSLK